MNRFILKVGRNILALIFPPACPICGCVTGSLIEGKLCDDCRDAFHKDYTSVCPICKQKAALCVCSPDVMGNEWDRSPFTTVLPLIFDGYYRGFNDDSPVAKLVFQTKRDRTIGSKMLLARIISAAVSRELTLRKINAADFTVTFIPRSKSAMREYGFDHMETVARLVAEMLGCRYKSLLIRKGGTEQKALGANERASNAEISISVDPRRSAYIKGARLIVIDDIITTGSTMRTAISKLSFAGADTIISAAAMISSTEKRKR